MTKLTNCNWQSPGYSLEPQPARREFGLYAVAETLAACVALSGVAIIIMGWVR